MYIYNTEVCVIGFVCACSYVDCLPGAGPAEGQFHWESAQELGGGGERCREEFLGPRD